MEIPDNAVKSEELSVLSLLFSFYIKLLSESAVPSLFNRRCRFFRYPKRIFMDCNENPQQQQNMDVGGQLQWQEQL